MSVVAVWLALFGMWPFFDPGHDDLGDPLVLADLALHATSLAYLWAIAPRFSKSSINPNHNTESEST